jgi:hypothetical protein
VGTFVGARLLLLFVDRKNLFHVELLWGTYIELNEGLNKR